MTIWTEPEHEEWTNLSDRTKEFIYKLTDKDNITVLVAPDTRPPEQIEEEGKLPAGSFLPGADIMRLDANQLLPTSLEDTTVVNPASVLSQRRFPAYIGVCVHESGHANYTPKKRISGNPFLTEWLTVMEEIRCESMMVNRFPHYDIYLKSSLIHVLDLYSFASSREGMEIEAIMQRYDIGRMATLSLGRALIGVIEPEETVDIETMVVDILGAEDLAALRKIWAEFIELHKTDLKRMLELAKEFQNIIDPEGILPKKHEEERKALSDAMKDMMKDAEKSPCGVPFPILIYTDEEIENGEQPEDTPQDGSEQKDGESSSEPQSSPQDGSEGDSGESESSSGDGDAEGDSGTPKNSTEGSKGGDSGDTTDTEKSSEDGKVNSDTEKDGESSNGNEDSSNDSEGESSSGNEGDTDKEEDSSNGSEGDSTDKEENSSSGSESESSNDSEDDPSDKEGASANNSDDDKGSSSAGGGGESVGDTSSSSGDSSPDKKGSESSEGQEGNDDAKNTDGSESDGSENGNDSDAQKKDSDVNANTRLTRPELSEIMREAVVKMTEISRNAQKEVMEDGKPETYPKPEPKDINKDSKHRKAAEKAKEKVAGLKDRENDFKNATIVESAWAKHERERRSGNSPYGTQITMKKALPEDKARSRAITVALQKAQYREVHKTTLDSTLPPGRFNVRQAMARTSQVASGQEITATPWKQTRRREIDNPPITLAVATDVSASMHAWQREVSSFTWAFSHAVKGLRGKAGALAWNVGSTALIQPNMVTENIPVASAGGGSTGCPSAMMALDSMMNLSFGDGVRVLAVITDGYLTQRGYANEPCARTQGVINELHARGVKVMWFVTRHDGWIPANTTATVLHRPEDFGRLVGKTIIESLAKA